MEPGKHVHTFFFKFIVLVRERDGPQVYSKLARRLCTSTCMLAQYLGSVVLLYVGRTLCWSSSTIVGHLTDTNTFWTRVRHSNRSFVFFLILCLSWTLVGSFFVYRRWLIEYKDVGVIKCSFVAIL